LGLESTIWHESDGEGDDGQREIAFYMGRMQNIFYFV
jgi:hypothetical protein